MQDSLKAEHRGFVIPDTGAILEASEAQVRGTIKTELGLFNSDEAAEFIGVASSTMRIYRMQGVGPKYVKLGGRIFYRKSDILRWFEDSFDATSSKQAARK